MKVILDLRGMVLRALHSGQVKGEAINSTGHAIQRFLEDSLLPILNKVQIKDVIAVGDVGNEYRKYIYPSYKAHRYLAEPEMQEARTQAQDAVDELLKCLGIVKVTAPGMEADDMIAWLVKYVPGNKEIYTVDKDLTALSSSTVSVLNPLGEEMTFTVDGLGVPAYAVPVVKSLIGDPSDGYPGIRGIGKVAVLKLVEDFGWDGVRELGQAVETGVMTDLVEATKQSGSKVLLKILENRDAWRLSWELAKLYPDLIGSRWGGKWRNPQWVKRVPNGERLKKLLEEKRCAFMLDDLKKFMPRQILVTKKITEEQMDWIKKEIEKSPYASIDLETSDYLQHPAFVEAAKGRTYVDLLSQKIAGLGLTFGENNDRTLYISFDHAVSEENVDIQQLKELFDLIPKTKQIVIQNVLFEEVVLLQQGIDISQWPCQDTKIMGSHVDEEESNGLKDMTLRWLGYQQTRYEDVVEKGKRMCDYPASHVFKYGADDPLVTAHLYDLFKLIMEIEGTYKFYSENEIAPVHILARSHLAGVTIDENEIERQKEEDSEVCIAGTANIRKAIKDNYVGNPEREMQAEDVLTSEWSQEITATAKAEGWPEEKKQAALHEIRKEAMLAVEYQDFNLELKEVKPPPLTITQLNKVIQLLGNEAVTEDILADRNALSAFAKTLPEELGEPLGKTAGAWKLDGGTVKIKEKEHQNGAVLREAMHKIIKEKAEKKWTKTGFEMNLDSPKQMQILLYGFLGLPIRIRNFKQTKKRISLGMEETTSQANVDAIRTAYAEDTSEGDWKRKALDDLIKSKEASTRIKMFYSKYPLWVHPKTGNIHPQINSCGTETRRPTGSSPNPLQWPKKGEGLKFRSCILPNKMKGHDVIVSIDWSSQELRIGAGLSKDEAMLDCFYGEEVMFAVSKHMEELLGEDLLRKLTSTDTKDIHLQTAAKMLGITYETALERLQAGDKKTKETRATAKPVNFGSIYGIGGDKLARKLLITVDQAWEYLKAKREAFPGFEEWKEKEIQNARDSGYLKTLYGSRRHLYKTINSSDGGVKSSAERQGINYMIQGLAADNLKVVMTRLWNLGTLQRHDADLIAPIYDELVMSCHHSQAASLITEVHEAMTRDIPGLPVPMMAEPSLGPSFGVQYEVGPRPSREIIEAILEKFVVREEQVA
jgi:DNA polymerase I-like protein with 3'-5' exonuclease and polymerase domains